MRQQRRLSAEAESWASIDSDASDLAGLVELLEANDPAIAAEILQELESLESRVDEFEVKLLLSGEHDDGDAFLTIQSGAGGTESQDWAEMLLRMYGRWAEKHGHTLEVVDVSPGEEAGIKSATIRMDGDFVYGYLKSERGVHRLVRLSPFDASNRRHTSFARIDVVPVLDDAVAVEIESDDLRIETFRASGKGGQHVNKTDSAVRITHTPSSIVVTCQNQRSQHQNREVAMQILRARLLERQMAERAEEHARLRGEINAVDFGSQIRSYVLHPYRLVKDLRTDVEVGNADGVLDGDLDVFMQSYLRSNLQTSGDASA